MIFLASLLAGCQGFKSKKGRAAGVDGGASVETSGLGQDDFDTADGSNKNKFKAPYDQTYYYSFDSSVLSEDDVQSITIQARYLAEHPNAKIFLAGHTCEIGSPKYNLGLGERRAKTVYDVLLLNGVKSNQIHLTSYGQEKPAVRGHDEEAYRKNRRAELKYEALG